jgi:hypothetical protein
MNMLLGVGVWGEEDGFPLLAHCVVTFSGHTTFPLSWFHLLPVPPPYKRAVPLTMELCAVVHRRRVWKVKDCLRLSARSPLSWTP